METQALIPGKKYYLDSVKDCYATFKEYKGSLVLFTDPVYLTGIPTYDLDENGEVGFAWSSPDTEDFPAYEKD